VLLKRGIDISLHRSRAVNRAMLDCSDIIIPLLSILKKDLISEYPDIGRKVFLPNELLGKEFTFYWEDTSVFPQDSRFYNFVHNDPSYINRNIDELEEYLRLAFSTILSYLLGPKEAGQKEIK
jgi:protein-tyrosine-phosphatase